MWNSQLFMLSLAVFAVAVGAACGGGDDSSGDDTGGDDEWFAQPIDKYSYPVQMFEAEIGREGRHFADGEFQGYGTVEYNTDPPTSGRHIGELVQAGVYDTFVPDEVAVHNMEHGFVIVWYNCNAGTPLANDDCATLRNDLTSVVQPAASAGKLVVQTPDMSMEHRIALTSWQFMDAFDEFDGERISAFIDTFECRYDPEHSC